MTTDQSEITHTRATAGWEFGSVAATDEDWASPEFDHVQPYIAEHLLDPARRFVGGRDWGEREAQRWRDARPYLIAHIRRTTGDPRWDPRGARVLVMRPTASTPEEGDHV